MSKIILVLEQVFQLSLFMQTQINELWFLNLIKTTAQISKVSATACKKKKEMSVKESSCSEKVEIETDKPHLVHFCHKEKDVFRLSRRPGLGQTWE